MKKIAAYLLPAPCVLLFLLLTLPSAFAQWGLTEEGAAAKIEALPKEERQVTMRNAATFTENDWQNFLKDLAQNYMKGPDGQIFALNGPETEYLPRLPDSDRYKPYLSWRMLPLRVQRYRLITGTVAAVPRAGVIIVSGVDDGFLPIRVGVKSAAYAEGDSFLAWCQRGQPYTFIDELGENRVIRSYVPVEVKKPELIDVSNYLVKGGRIIGLAPSLTKMCPVCKGFRKYSPNVEIPSETIPCDSCDATGKVRIRPLYIVYTGSKDL